MFVRRDLLGSRYTVEAEAAAKFPTFYPHYSLYPGLKTQQEPEREEL